ncbi:MAG: adenylyltransferase/cytidyltransferase family protein [Rickettsiaceae bacterium]
MNDRIFNLQSLNFLHHTNLKVAILGGTFDPAHLGHVSISIQALNYYHFDYVIWLVAKQNPFKSTMSNSIFNRARSALQVARHPRIIVSTAEHDLAGCYSYNVLKELIHRFSTVKFTWIMGMDNAVGFKKWYRSNDLKKLCNILILDRPCQARMVNMQTLGLYNQVALAKIKSHNIMIHRGKLCNLSSTTIRS